MAVQFAKPALDRLLSEVMTGFGAIPRRGAEVGGILVGRAEAGTIWVDEVVVTPCEHRRGPSFLLSESDTAKFDEAFANAAAAGGPAAPVGLFRSNTRDHDELGDEDRALYAKTFLSGDGVFLVIRPFATKPPTGSFLFGLDAKLPQTASEVFEFGRGEQPSSAQPRRRMTPEPAVGSGSAAVPVKVRVPLPRPAPAAGRKCAPRPLMSAAKGLKRAAWPLGRLGAMPTWAIVMLNLSKRREHAPAGRPPGDAWLHVAWENR